MPSRQIKPRPTEYRNIVFRSKAEARVALLYDKCGLNWWYEPEFLRLDNGYVPDFLIVVCDRGGDPVSQTANFSMITCIVEYKPTRPTDTYLDELVKNLDECTSRIDLLPGSQVCDYLITGGMGYSPAESVYPGIRKHRNCGWKSGWRYPLIGLDIDAANEKLNGFRFDLQGAAS